MSFRLVANAVTLNELERRNGRYIALFHRFGKHRSFVQNHGEISENYDK